MVRLQVVINGQEAEKLRTLAIEQNRTLSGLLRHLILMELDEHDKTNNS